jgi:hypothetical protein
MALYDKLTKGTAQPEASRMSAIEQVLQAKKGKVSAAPTLSQPSLSEQAVQDETASLLRQGAAQGGVQQATQQAEIQGQQQSLAQQADLRQQQYQANRQALDAQSGMQHRGIAAQEQMAGRNLDANKARKIDQINASASRALAQLAAESQLTTDDIFANFRRENKDLAARRDAAQLEQLGHILALQDQSYLDELNRIGERRRFYDKAEWAKEKQRLIYGENLNNVMNDLGFRRGEDIKDRQFQEQLAYMGAEDALKVAMAAIQDANNAAIASGVISGTKAGVSMYQESNKKEPK